ncbi:MAG: SusC/RagA family TonB-linked outer membrane protein [Mucilaginibacter sp.]|uniref:SusC/RagA family TonB-linked outer membrane protein n=1 Tax=Mucilaginibacter sp. L3T2-6 TaxID=3062491 RepID=UPI0026766CAD|nr:SusC/RagA family TonB-linked outer membrane protein [Mucilaginibacter sp. L3T2-6]MDO3643616.1 SusC/RagA family TonB-linked outer membrane protein [Mucilaginibacter sp. L3T2-6]MDV6216136.1 SusC/RagA family TonB-linked outer membrane protein [Mucilaginibacter sp. L3T2-6]
MKLTLFFIVLFSLQSIASGYSQQKVTITTKSADFKKIVAAIQRQTDYRFVFSERKIPLTNKIDLNVKDEEVTSVLKKVLANSGYSFTVLANNLIVITTGNETVTNVTVTGKVLDETGLPAPGVSIRLKGTTVGTVTDAEGNFSISVPDNATLVVSFLGYETQEIALAGRTTLTIKLTVSAKSLNEVVVTALGIKKDEKKLGYAITTVNGSAIDKAKEPNVAYSLEGRVAGLSISGTNGGAGSSARILLRGVTSTSKTQGPLFVINGVPMDNTQRGQSGEWGGADYGDGIANINPDDIESITVLKGQSASALYGTRATGGVILITTKSGKKNSGFGVEFNSNFQADKVVNNTDFQTEYGQGENGKKPVNAADALSSGSLAWGAKLDGSQVPQFDGKSYAYSKTSDDWTHFYKTGHTFTNTVALTGGNETGAFRLSLSDLNNHAITPNSGLDRKTFNFNGSQTVIKNLDVNLVANYILDNEKNRSGLSDGPGNPNNVQFLAPNEAQSILAPGTKADGTEQSFTNDVYVTNPYFAAYNFISNTTRERLISSISAKYAITPWAYVQGRLGYDKINDTRFGVTPTGTAYNSGNNGSVNTQTTQLREFNADVLLGAKHDLVKDLLNLDLSLGGNIRKNQYSGTYINANNLIIPYFYDLSNGQTRTSGNVDNTYRLQVNSAYYTADFGIKNFLVLSTNGRYDYYSSISKAVGPGIFTPSVSASFIFSEFTHISALDFGKLRISYAQTSGGADPYSNQIYYSVANAINGVSAGSFSNQLPNVLLKPYTLSEFEIGTELKFFKDRLGLDVAYFDKKTKNEIVNSSIDISSGYTNAYVATASMQNKGIEVEIHGSPVVGAFTWTPSFNFTYVKNKVLSTDANGNNIGLGTYRPLNATTAFVKGMPGPQIMANDYKRDASGNIIFDATGNAETTGRIAMGSVTPKIYGGLNNDFSYKHFNLSFLVDYRFGNKVLSATNYYSIFRGENKMTLPGRETGVVGVGVTESGAQNTTNVPAETYYQTLARNVSALNVLDGSFIKLRQVTLGYTIPSEAIAHTPFNSITLSAVARNLWTIMKHTDNIDPESNFAPGINYAGIEGTSVPAVRTYGFNLNFKFKK